MSLNAEDTIQPDSAGKLPIQPIDNAVLTVLVDNKADLIVKSGDRVKYFSDQPLLAEHGFAVLIQLGAEDGAILWDAGVSRTALPENLRRMKIDPASITKIALSHGHFDHYAALTELLEGMDLLPGPRDWEAGLAGEAVETWLEDQRIPVVAHPAAFRERWWVKDDGTLHGPVLPPPEQAWQAAGARIVRAAEPVQLGPGCWTTGYIPRQSFETAGRPTRMRYRVGNELRVDDLEDDQAVMIHIKDKGLVVLTGCAHSGIVNTVRYAQERSGVARVYAVLGGFHLAGAREEEIDRTIAALETFEPALIVPCHCTGFRGMCRLAQGMPEAFVEGVVGAQYQL